MRVRRWLIAAVVTAFIAAACGNGPSTAPGGPSVAGASASPAGSQDPLALLAARLNDAATAQQATTEARAQIRDIQGVSAVLGPDAQATLDALDAMELRVINAAITKIPETLAGSTATVDLASYVRPAPDGAPTTANPMITAIISVFVEPLISEAMDRGKGSFNVTQKEAEPKGGGHQEQGSFTMHAAYSGGLLQGGFEGSFSATTGEPPNAKTVSETFAMSFTITPCPDASGKVALELTYTEESLASGPTANTHSQTKITLHALMNVDDDAELVGTDVTSHMEGSEGKTTAAGESTEGSSKTDMSFGVSAGGDMGSPDVSGLTGDGDAQRSAESRSVGLLMATFLLPTVNTAAKTARTGWRNNKCVELVEVTPDSKEVTAKERVDIAATLKHRVTDEELHKKVKATVQGKGTVDPAQADGPKVKYVYTAGEAFGDTGTVELRSVSNRGIASKTLTFTIRGKWTLAATGTFTEMIASAGVTFGAELNVSIDPIALSVDESGQITGQGPIHFSGHPVFPPGTPCTGSYDSTETLIVKGTQETSSGAPQLALTLSAPPGHVTASMHCPGGAGGTYQYDMSAGFGGNMFNNTVSQVVLPAAGGSLDVDKTGTSAIWSTHAVVTFVLTVADSAP